MDKLFKVRNEEIFKSFKDIVWFDKEGILDLDTHFISFLLDDVGTKDVYNGVHIHIF